MSKSVSEMEERGEIEERYLFIKEAARMLGVSERSVYGYVERGEIAGERGRYGWMVKEADVRAFVRRAPGRKRLCVNDFPPSSPGLCLHIEAPPSKEQKTSLKK